MTKFIPVLALLIGLLTSAQTCTAKQEVNPCYLTQESRQSIAWQKDQLAFFQQPKSETLRVVVSHYDNEYFLAYENLTLSSPMSFIFDCSSTSLGKRGINYNRFTRQAKEVVTLVEGKY